MTVDVRCEPICLMSRSFSIPRVILLFESLCGRRYRVLEQSQVSCCVELRQDDRAGEVLARLDEFLTASLPGSGEGENSAYRILVDGIDFRESPLFRPLTLGKPGPDAAEEPPVLAVIGELPGAGPFKELCRRLTDEAPGHIAAGTAALACGTALLFAADEGSGADEAVVLLDRLLHETGLIRTKLDPVRLQMTRAADDTVYLQGDDISRAYALPRLVVLSLDAVVGMTGRREVRSVLLEIFRKNNGCVTVLRMPYATRDIREKTLADLRGVLPAELVPFPPLSGRELRLVAERELARYALTAEEQVWPAFQSLVEEHGRRGSFYGADTARKVADEMIVSFRRLPGTEGDGTTIPTAAVKALLPQAGGKTEPGSLRDLDAMIGRDAVAAQVRALIRGISFARRDPRVASPAMHMVFTGNPGTGKTTAARMIGRALRDSGVLRVGDFVECQGRDFVGQYVGQTAPKTRKICERAYGSVLFIDEAYMLACSPSDRDYGQEALATLMAEMENHRDDMVVIFAGYTGEMERFLDANPGLRSRVPYHVRFPNYSREELVGILHGMIRSRFRYEPELLDASEEYLLSLPDEVLDGRSFGNGRFVRNLYERIWNAALERDTEAGPDELVLIREDLAAAVVELDVREKILPRKARIGF